MVVRLKLRIRRGDIAVEEVALLNSGYEAPTPQLLIPVELARRLGLWPPEGAADVLLDTAGGPLRAWYFPREASVEVAVDDERSQAVVVDLVISPLADEPLISDKLAGALQIAVEDFAEGLWRFRWEPKEVLRRSASR